jgi:hypothetical protein
MLFSKQCKILSRALLIAAMTLGTTTAEAQQKQKSNVQRERCAQVATRAINTPGNVYYAAPVRGHGGGGGGIAGAIIGAVVITAIAASIAASAKQKAENQCLVAAGLRPNTEAEVSGTSGDKPKRTGATSGRTSGGAIREAARNEVGSGGGQAWIRRSIRSQQ